MKTWKVKWDNGCGDHFVTIVKANNETQAVARASKVIEKFGSEMLFWDTVSDYITVEEYSDVWAKEMPWLRDWEEFCHENDGDGPRYY